MSKLHCPIIHGALHINLMRSKDVYANSCCLRKDLFSVPPNKIWNSPTLIPLRKINLENQWDPGCWICQGNEAAGQSSFRSGMLEKFGVRTDLSGPQRLDLMFDNSCNLACRSCTPDQSTFWQKHLRDNNIPTSSTMRSRPEDMINILKTLDLSNLEMVVFCGGETLLGQSHWQVAEAIADLAPYAKEKVIVSFQTNGTQPINLRNISTIEKFHLVKMNISLDAVGEKFNYLRWPANWTQVTENILQWKETLPTNVMFLIEETMSVLNLCYQNELEEWVKQNFNTNRLGDPTNHTRHAASGFMSLQALTQEYVDSLRDSSLYNLIPNSWQENPTYVTNLISTLNKFDAIRNQDWRVTFPKLIEFYKRYDISGI